MSNLYNLEGIKTELNKRMSRAKTLLQAWEKVTFPTKKDGTSFKTMSKNIAGATYKQEKWTLQEAYSYELKVIEHDSLNGYVDDTIKCYDLIKYMKKDDTRLKKSENIMPKEPMLEQLYMFDLEDIKEAVENRIQYFKNSIEKYEQEIAKADKAYNVFKEAYTNAIKELQNVCGCTDDDTTKNTLFYAVKDTIVDRYPYC